MRTQESLFSAPPRLRVETISRSALRAVVALTCVIIGLACGSADQADRPNIILFLVDDMGWQDTSVPFHSSRTPFNDRYRTPNMERLAARGMLFTNAYASSPVCTPTRTSIMTGRAPARTHITFWTLHKDTDTTRGHPSLTPPAWNMNGLQESDITLPRLLQSAGYRTIHVGKAHFGAHGTGGSDPTNLGFSITIAGHGSGGPASYYGEHHFSVAGREGNDPDAPGAKKTVWDVPGLEAYHGRNVYLTEALALEASAAIDSAIEAGEPFFMNFAPYAVHAPIMANKRYLENYQGLHPREAAYATMIETMDAALGTLLDTLEAHNATDDTIIIFSSDNGGLSAHARGGLPHTHNAPLRSGKGSAREGGVRVPTIIAWPGVTDSPSRNDTPIISHDFFPTILACARVEIPDGYRDSADGVDLGTVLRGEREETLDSSRDLIWHMPHTWGARGPGIAPFSSIRSGDWKLIYYHATRSFELFNLKDDLRETTNLFEFRPEIARDLAQKLSDHLRARGAQMSIDKTTGEPVPLPIDAMGD